LRRVDTILRGVHKTAPLGNKRDPLDELMFIQMTVRTRNAFSTGLYKRVKTEVGGKWGRLLGMPVREFRTLLRPAGMAKVKAGRLRGILSGIQQEFGKIALTPLKSMSDERAEEFLRSLPGVGPKVARCVLLYSLDRKVFPVDTHCRRIIRRFGLLPAQVDDRKSHDFLQRLVPPSIRHTLHVNLVHHGKRFCRPHHPLCGTCPLKRLCPTGRAQLRPTRTKSRD
jgi:endonuclease III